MESFSSGNEVQSGSTNGTGGNTAIAVPDLKTVRRTVQKHFPSLWAAVEVSLSACATLLLKDNVNPVTMIIVGPPSAGKTTVTNMFEEAQWNGQTLCYRSDGFTPASFVSHSAKASRGELEKIDLLPKIKNRVLLTPELAPIFRGDQDELTRRFATLTRVLDGQGLKTDSGTHGERGYEGEYVFVWIGATTPFDGQVWKVMAQLGSRLFFLLLDTGGHSTSKETLDDLIASHQGISYAVKLQECKSVTGAFLTALFTHHRGPRQVEWESSHNPQVVLEGIGRFAMLIAQMRTPYEPDSKPEKEDPKRANSVLYNLACGHALVHGRTVLTEADLPMVSQVALSSLPRQRRALWIAFAQQNGKPLTVQQAMTALKVCRHTAETRMKEMEWLGVATFTTPGNGQASTLLVHPDWSWFVSGTGREFVLGTTWQNSGDACEPGTISPSTSPEREERRGDAHAPPKNCQVHLLAVGTPSTRARLEWAALGSEAATSASRNNDEIQPEGV
ncbi:MAG: hypothetical protein E8D52_14815 [Nitrospira sp.]|nr:MAG: hypothetical protein E8D52_14815 [Nitrospira sp.]